MNEILDHNPNENTPKSNLFSKLAFGCAVIIISCLIIVFKMTSVIKASDGLNAPKNFKYVGGLMLVSIILGFVFSLLSYSRKEKLKYFKPIAIVINSLSFVLIVLMIIINMITS
jgi:hypothetical protein